MTEIDSDILLQAICSNDRKITIFSDFDHYALTNSSFFLNGKTPEILRDNGYKTLCIEIDREYQEFIDLYSNGSISRSSFISSLPNLKGGVESKSIIADTIDKYKAMDIKIVGVDSARFHPDKYDDTIDYLDKMGTQEVAVMRTAAHYKGLVELNCKNAIKTKDYYNKIDKDIKELEEEYNKNPKEFCFKYNLDDIKKSPPDFNSLSIDDLSQVFGRKHAELRLAYDKEVAEKINDATKKNGGKTAVMYGAFHGMFYDDGISKSFKAKKDLDGFLEDMGNKLNIIGLIPSREKLFDNFIGCAEIPNTIILTKTVAGEDKDKGPCEVLHRSDLSFARDYTSPLAKTTVISQNPDEMLDKIKYGSVSPSNLDYLTKHLPQLQK